MEGAGLDALAAANAQLLVDNINALGILGNSTGFAGSSALTTLDTNHGLGLALQINDLDTGLVGMELFVKSLGASLNAFQTCHALSALFDSQFLHIYSPFEVFFLITISYYTWSYHRNQSTRFFSLNIMK